MEYLHCKQSQGAVVSLVLLLALALHRFFRALNTACIWLLLLVFRYDILDLVHDLESGCVRTRFLQRDTAQLAVTQERDAERLLTHFHEYRERKLVAVHTYAGHLAQEPENRVGRISVMEVGFLLLPLWLTCKRFLSWTTWAA
jgi:hypothetical protein